MELVYSSPCLKYPATGPQSERDASSPQILNTFSEDEFQFYPDIRTSVFPIVSFLQIFRPKICMQFSSFPRIWCSHAEDDIHDFCTHNVGAAV